MDYDALITGSGAGDCLAVALVQTSKEGVGIR